MRTRRILLALGVLALVALLPGALLGPSHDAASATTIEEGAWQRASVRPDPQEDVEVYELEPLSATAVSEGPVQVELLGELPEPPADGLQHLPRGPRRIPGLEGDTGEEGQGLVPALDGPESTAGDVDGGATAGAGPGDFVTFRNTAVATGDPPGKPSLSYVNEPSVGNNDDAILYSGNWYAANSGDRGKTWNFIDPYDSFPADGVNDDATGTGGRFCCDQVVIDVPSEDLVAWYLQYTCGFATAFDTRGCDVAGEENGQRLVVARGRNDLAAGTFDCSWLLRPTQVGFTAGFWYDYPHLARTANYLYVTTNMFPSSPNDLRAYSVMMRFSLSDLAACPGTLNYGAWVSPCTVAFLPPPDNRPYCSGSNDWFTFTPAQNGGTTQYIGSNWNWGEISNATNDRFAIYSWTDANALTLTVRNVASWEATLREDANCPGPDGNDACEFFDQRVMTGWNAGGVVGFMFMVDEEPPDRPYPFTRVVQFNKSDLSVAHSGFDIFNTGYAWVYPSVAVNARGHIGGSIVTAGGTRNPQSTLWIWDDFQGIGAVSGHVVRDGTNGPPYVDRDNDGDTEGRWGDYVTARPADGNPFTWIATGFTLQGGKAGANTEPRFFWFGRERDRPTLASNDYFSNARTISSLPYSNKQDTTGATGESQEPIPPGNQGCSILMDTTVWYKYTPSSNETLVADTFGSNYDTQIVVWSGTDIKNLTFIGCNDDTGGLQSEVKFPVSAGTTYYFQLDGFGAATGNLVFNLTVQPPDLIVQSVVTDPVKPLAGQDVGVTVTVENQGTSAATSFWVDFYKDLAAAPGRGQVGDIFCGIEGLAAGAKTTCEGTVSYASAGSYAMWAQVDTSQNVAESDEDNNVLGPQKIDVNPPEPTDTATPTATATSTSTSTPTSTPTVEVTVRAGSGSAAPGGQVTIPVDVLLPADATQGSFTVEVKYDTSLLGGVDCTPNSGGEFDFGSCNADFSAGVARCTGISSLGVSGPAEVGLCDITFEADAAAPAGTSIPLVVNCVVKTDPGGDPLLCNTQDGKITIGQGDVNCDGVVNVVDALFVLQFEVGQRVDSGGCPLPPPPPDTLNVAGGDVNKDELTNVVDALFILQCEVGEKPGANMPFCQ